MQVMTQPKKEELLELTYLLLDGPACFAVPTGCLVFCCILLTHLLSVLAFCLEYLAWIYSVQLSWSIPVSGVVDMHALCW
jgi:hypothetical protein